MTVAAVAPKTGLILSCPFAKIDEELREVWGIATTEALDVQGEVVDYEASKKAFAEWTEQFSKVTSGESLGNIREMHQPKPVGKLISWKADDALKQIRVGVKISRSPDGEAAWAKVKERVLNGFSIGAPVAERRMEYVAGRPRNRVVSYSLSELSLVDNPACPEAWITEMKLAKSAGVTGRLSEPASFSDALDVFTDTTTKTAPVENAFVDSGGGVWKRINGVFAKGEQPMFIENLPTAKSGKKIGPTHSPEGKPPGVETPTVQGDPDAGQVLPKKAADTEGSKVIPGGPHDSASKPVEPPPTQGKAAGDMAYGSAGAPPPPFPPPAAPQGAAPASPAPAAPPAPPAPARYAYCAMCAGKLADGSLPVHQECGGQQAPRPPAPPPAPAPAAPPAAPPGLQRSVTVATPDTTPISMPDGQGKAAAAMSEGLEKAFASSLGLFKVEIQNGFTKMNEALAGVVSRVEKIEKTPIPGGPARTELPNGVSVVEKGGGSTSNEFDAGQQALEKVFSMTADPFLKDKLSMEMARFGIMKAQAGR